MTHKKIVYIIPGMNTSPSYKPFLDVAKIFKANGVRPILVSINWESPMDGYVKQFIKKYNDTKNKGDKIYLFGFSAGAWIAFMATTKLDPYMTILCSPSPYFREDIPYWKKSWIDEIGEKRFQSFYNYKFKTIIKKFRSKAIIFIGDKEYRFMLRRANAIHKSVNDSRLIVIRSGEHSIGKMEYMRALKKNLNKDNLF